MLGCDKKWKIRSSYVVGDTVVCLAGAFSGGLDLHQVSEEKQELLPLLDNYAKYYQLPRRHAGVFAGDGLPDMTKIHLGMSGSAYQIMNQ